MLSARSFSLAALTVAELSPPDMVSAAARAGYAGVSLTAGAALLPAHLRGVAPSSVVDDAALLRETRSRARGTGIAIDMIEGAAFTAEFDIDAFSRAADVGAELGVTHFAALVFDTDHDRLVKNLRRAATVTGERRMTIDIEFTPRSEVRRFGDAVALIRENHLSGVGILVDALHLARGGDDPAVIATAPELVTSCQLCDGPLRVADAEAARLESIGARLSPGSGALPLRALLEILPKGTRIWIEVPMNALRDAGVDACARAQMVLKDAQSVADSPGRAP